MVRSISPVPQVASHVQTEERQSPGPSDGLGQGGSSEHRPPAGLNRRNSSQGSAAGGSEGAMFGPRVAAKLIKYSASQPYTSPMSYVSNPASFVATDEVDQGNMPRIQFGWCWGGSALREGVSKQLLAANADEVVAIAADSYLLAKRQRTENIIWTLSKGIYFPVHLLPMEGAINANQTKNLAKEVLREQDVNMDRLRKIDFSKMSLKNKAQSTPIRPGLNVRSSVLPRNTQKTRAHLCSVLPQGEHENLNTILNDRQNYLDVPSTQSVEGAILSESGWQKIISIIINGREIDA
jgi:hypothetical protein